MRRFAFVEVTSPDEDKFRKLVEGPGEIVSQLLILRSFRDLGPAVYLDAAKFAARRALDGPSDSRLLYEVFYGYFLPQFEGMNDDGATLLFRAMATVLDEPEQAEAERTISEVLGVQLRL
jgi:hypothetical protein